MPPSARGPLPSRIPEWPIPFDPAAELDWGDPEMSRRLLREHLDQSHDGASRRERVIATHLRRLQALVPPAPADVLDAACGPGLYAARLGKLGYRVTGIDIGEPVLAHARQLARSERVSASFACVDLRVLEERDQFDVALLIYFVLESFPRGEHRDILRRLAHSLRPGGRLVAELRARPEQPPGRLSGWQIVPWSLLSDQPHLLLSDTTWDAARRQYILREIALHDDGSVAVQQTSGHLHRLEEVEPLFRSAGLRVRGVYDGWTRFRATALSQSLLVVADRPIAKSTRGRPKPRL